MYLNVDVRQFRAEIPKLLEIASRLRSKTLLCKWEKLTVKRAIAWFENSWKSEKQDLFETEVIFTTYSTCITRRFYSLLGKQLGKQPLQRALNVALTLFMETGWFDWKLFLCINIACSRTSKRSFFNNITRLFNILKKLRCPKSSVSNLPFVCGDEILPSMIFKEIVKAMPNTCK